MCFVVKNSALRIPPAPVAGGIFAINLPRFSIRWLETRLALLTLLHMSKAEIIAELPKLTAEDRSDILARLWQMEETSGPTDREKQLLDEAQAAYEANPDAGSPWSEVEARLRRRV